MSKIKKGDKIKVLLGKDRGKEGQVEKVFSKEGKVLILGVNIYKRHVKKQGQTEGGIIEIPKPINISNVVLMCPLCKKPTRISFKKIKDSKLRVCKKCKKEINE
ncbi:50S ribosomal protein L24 [Candidatus Daviesbacteria bacterium RIFCSPLOWO2_01_FULL_38_10]|uniref:Large ribosomal subunit protein uL24 n=1 Tax=Candidatus Daviesbacteria bacterium GW2011_GWF2_38_6 TaxID=1618432 RepID=A0A0G0MSJ9_9BACT|nr:MAG: 50S ribosomal protein L24 [Candidatus Daviesbacteria bacterium GW2011_GWA2_38_17]KKQ76644.1 MAG: 50S ribosomal protein L24 [Candidatus Daviesbacteria bacterium GW2011_GWF2_38_6]OGE27162.1 MAG: 50S ribosomal protein L24 [Candidatus Daviesbacteria bacterium RIFCSPHIGHO2_02_FULL_39_41]OGE29313.1 MAG: 50S ribosomal protein L24 [Candidatus Daviesbacteria bacterium RIFCSPHIGHO2_01_FULL_38_8b]OGE40227.1 MAG: 50S ribosomal protein L24 [Candidatus Daviesbacteria bacterium RIFCSPLOWO2_01_FULL_38_